MLWVPSYNRLEPALGGVPFFYWYQLAWILLGAGIVLLVYHDRDAKITHRRQKAKRRHHGRPRRHPVTLDLTATIVFVVAVPVRHLARLRRGALAQGRSQSAA